jgi:hypothetical protein
LDKTVRIVYIDTLYKAWGLFHGTSSLLAVCALTLKSKGARNLAKAAVHFVAGIGVGLKLKEVPPTH